MAKGINLKDNTYDRLKWIAQIALPATGAAYFGLAVIWGLPAGEQVVGSLAVVGTLLGALLGLSAKGYEDDGLIGVRDPSDDEDSYTPNVAMLLNKNPEVLARKKYVRLKVEPGADVSDLQRINGNS